MFELVMAFYIKQVSFGGRDIEDDANFSDFMPSIPSMPLEWIKVYDVLSSEFLFSIAGFCSTVKAVCISFL